MTTTKIFKTPLQEKREKRNQAMCNEYTAIMQVERQSKTQVIKHLMDKYQVASTSTVYTILKEGGAI